MTGEDYIKALENWQDFLNTEIVEDTSGDETYPVGIGYSGIKIRFVHYDTFDKAIEKWNQRKARINPDNIAFMFTNYAGGGTHFLNGLTDSLLSIKSYLQPENIRISRALYT